MGDIEFGYKVREDMAKLEIQIAQLSAAVEELYNIVKPKQPEKK